MVSGGQHAAVLPDDCARCRDLFAVLAARHEAAPDSPVTLALLGQSVGLTERPTRTHLAHLVKHRRVMPDRRTPAPGATCVAARPLPDDITPLAWAASAEVPCRSCGVILRELAVVSRGTWRGQISMGDLGKRAALSEHAARMHARTGHTASGRIGHSLVAASLVAFESRAERTGTDRNGRPMYVRRPDAFTLWPTRERPLTAAPLSETWQQGQAEVLLTRCVWFDRSHPQAVWIVRLVGALLGDDWPEPELERRLNVTPRTDAPLARPYLFARKRLPKRGERPVLTVPEVVGIAVPMPGRLRECVECCDPLPRSAAPDVVLCGPCRTARAALPA
jgi:hypothetical protein